MDFNYSSGDIMTLGVEAACKEAYAGGTGEGRLEGFQFGIPVGIAIGHAMATDAASPVAMYKSGPHTVLKYRDGSKTRVTYDEDSGRPYDTEKAVMAAMLKHLAGNAYLRALSQLMPDAEEGSRDPVEDDEPEIRDDKWTTDPVSIALDGDVHERPERDEGDLGHVFGPEDAELLQELYAMGAEPMFDPQEFADARDGERENS